MTFSYKAVIKEKRSADITSSGASQSQPWVMHSWAANSDSTVAEKDEESFVWAN